MSLAEIPLTTLDGNPTSLADYAGRALLVVNVASKCGLTPQYGALEQLARDYGDRGLTVIGVPCNQFMGQEPGTPEEIATIRAATTLPVLVGSGVDAGNVGAILSVADGVIVASSLKRDGVWWNEVDPARLERFMAAVERVR